MWKLLTLILVVYLIIKFSRYVLKAFYYTLTGDQVNNQNPKRRKRPSDGNVDIDYIPDDYNKSRSDHHKGAAGEYVEYEEVKK